MKRRRRFRFRARHALLLFVVGLGASHALRGLRGRPDPIEPGSILHAVELPVLDRNGLVEDPEFPGPVKVVLEEFGPKPVRGATENLPVVLLHGSPGRRNDLAQIGFILGKKRATVRPDLPGFGRSTRRVPDYSIYAHARYVRALCDRLGIDRFHVVGFSMGGGVAIALTDLLPDRVASLTLMAATGVQELELLGDYDLNHLVHGLQVSMLWGLHELVPHFGLLDDALLSVEFARNFFDTDQRPLRGFLEAWEGPTLIQHGPTDPLVPVAAAYEHERIVPQAELRLYEGSHFLPFVNSGEVGADLDDFLDRAESGAAATRTTADPVRIARAQEPFDPAGVPAIAGFGLVFFGFLIVLATFVSEDLTCIAVGALVGQGRIGFLPGVISCILGLAIGDLLIFLAGRWVGRRALHRAPLRWFLSPERVEASSVWLERRGALVIFLTRFLPGSRLPTYFASGILRTSVWRFSLWFFLAAGIWTPLLVWLSGSIGGALTDRVKFLEENLALGLIVTLAVVFVMVKIVRPLLSHRGRRRLRGAWMRIRHFEFWPVWVFYVPVAFYCAWRALIERRLLAFTASNPLMPHSGVIGESKSAILRALAPAAGDALPATLLLPAGLATGERLRRVHAFRQEHRLGFPLVLKPDVGERGEGVCILHAEAELEAALEGLHGPWIVQEFCEGVEYGLFYARHPSEERGRIFSVTQKELPTVRGDGRRTLETLILDDPRAVAQAPFLLARNGERLGRVPAAGERVLLGEIGSHCRGTLFRDGAHVVTPELEQALDRIAAKVPGFFFGRFDVKSDALPALKAGRFRILELNGVTSESGNAYDPSNSVWRAWGILFHQWKLAYAIGAENVRRGARTTGPIELLVALYRAGRARRRDERARDRPEVSVASGAVPLSAPAKASSEPTRRI